MQKYQCETCKFWQLEGTERSGIFTPDGRAEWIYPIGKCQNIKSVHGGWEPNRKISKPSNMPNWGSCHLHKKR